MMIEFLDASYQVDGADILRLVHELTTRWQSFANENDSGRRALSRLVVSGLAKVKLSYTVKNHRTGECIRLRCIACGDLFSDLGHKKMLRWIAAQCPVSWCKADVDLNNVNILADSHNWEMAISDDGVKLRGKPDGDNAYMLVEAVRTHNASGPQHHPIKDGYETWQEAVQQSVKFSRHRDVANWIKVLKRLGETVSEDTFRRRRKGESVPSYRVNPNSSRTSISLAVADLPADYSDDL